MAPHRDTPVRGRFHAQGNGGRSTEHVMMKRRDRADFTSCLHKQATRQRGSQHRHAARKAPPPPPPHTCTRCLTLATPIARSSIPNGHPESRGARRNADRHLRDFRKAAATGCPQGTYALHQYRRCQAPRHLAAQPPGGQPPRQPTDDGVRHAFACRIAADRRRDGRLTVTARHARHSRRSHLDFNKEYAAHQQALMRADNAACNTDRRTHLARASSIAGRISAFQEELGAAAACAWSMAQVSAPDRI